MREITWTRTALLAPLLCLTMVVMTHGQAEMEEEAEVPMEPLAGKRIAFLIGEGVHDTETLVPMGYLAHRGAEVVTVGVKPGSVEAYNEFRFTVQKLVSEVDIEDFDALVIPGGSSPAYLREHESAVAFTRDFYNSGGVVAGICHGPQVMVSAGILEGRTATCVGSIRDEITEAGGEYVDEPVVRDDRIITSRVPRDLSVFSRTIEQALLEADEE